MKMPRTNLAGQQKHGWSHGLICSPKNEQSNNASQEHAHKSHTATDGQPISKSAFPRTPNLTTVSRIRIRLVRRTARSRVMLGIGGSLVALLTLIARWFARLIFVTRIIARRLASPKPIFRRGPPRSLESVCKGLLCRWLVRP
jgi:hypothetical protein